MSSVPYGTPIGDLALPYAAFWIWMIIMCIQLVRKPGAVLRAADGRASLADRAGHCALVGH